MGRTPLLELRGWRRMAGAALRQFGLPDARPSLLKCGENITYRVRHGAGKETLLRIHRPVYHTPGQVLSELHWLRALAGATEVPVPRPLETTDGELLAMLPSEHGAEPHVSTMLEWMPGRQSDKALPRAHMRALGVTMAHLHEHALAWKPPGAFDRLHLDWNGLLGRISNWGTLDHDPVELFAPADRDAVREGLQRIRAAMQTLDRLAGTRALIHADLHLGNVVFSRAPVRACPIDFDDSGFGYLVYDLATTLIPYRDSPRWPELRDALLEGYSQVRTLPAEQLAFLPHFLAARAVTMGIWLKTRQTLIPRLPRDLGPYLARTAGRCRELL